MTTAHATLSPAQRRPSNYPKLSLSDALALYFIIEQGEPPVSVEQATAEQFKAFINQAIFAYQSSKRASEGRLNALKEELAELDYANPVDRWYCILLMQEYRIALPIFEDR